MRVKRWLMGGVLMLCVTTAAHAFLPVAGLIAWLSVGTAAESAAGIAASIAVNTGIITAFALSFWKKDENNKPTGSAPTVTVYLNPNKARENPDPTKFDDPAAGSRDVTPKATTSGSRTSTNVPAGAAPPPEIWCQNGACATSQSGACLAQSANPSSGTQGNYTWTAHFEFTNGQCYIVKDWSNGESIPGAWGYAEKFGNNTTKCPGINLTASDGKCPASNFPETGPITCPEGYSASSDGTGCNLTDGNKVMKPDSQPCELLRGATGGLETDSRNPNCKLPEVQVSGNSIQVDSQSISFNGDGSVSVANPTGQTTFQISGYNADGSANITGISRSGNPNNYDTTTPSTGGGLSGGGSSGGGSTGTSPVCGGVGQPSCSGNSNGNGGGSCGGPGQPACTIDDSGFSGKNVSTAAAESALDGINADRTNMLDTIKNGVITPEFSWRPPVQNMACQPLEFGFFKGMNFTLNWCKYIHLIHDAISFLAYCLTALYLFGLLFGASKREAK